MFNDTTGSTIVKVWKVHAIRLPYAIYGCQLMSLIKELPSFAGLWTERVPWHCGKHADLQRRVYGTHEGESGICRPSENNVRRGVCGCYELHLHCMVLPQNSEEYHYMIAVTALHIRSYLFLPRLNDSSAGLICTSLGLRR